MGVRSGERGGHAIGAPTWETGVEILALFSKVMRGCTVLLEVNASFLVIFIQLWNEELLEHVQIHDTGNGFKVVKLFLKHPVLIAHSVVQYFEL